MTPLVWVNIPLALVFLLAVVGIPLWMTFRRPQRPADDHPRAHAYLAARAALVHGGGAARRRQPGQPVTAGRR